MHQDKFFKDRKWLFLEFPELLPSGARSQAINRCLSNQEASDPPTGSSTDTETRQQQHNGPTHHHRNTDTSSHQTESCQGVTLEKNEAAIETTTFRGQHASFRILEVSKLTCIDFNSDCFNINCCMWTITPYCHISLNKHQQNIFFLRRLDAGLATVYFPSLNP